MSAEHPYSTAPDAAFWSRSVATGYEAAKLLQPDEPLVRRSDRVATAGSCFAANLVPYLERSGLSHLQLEPEHPMLSDIAPERLGYRQFSAAYGNVYTARQLLQLLRRSLGTFRPSEDRWHGDAGVFDPFRPGLRYHALSDREFDRLQAQHLRCVEQVFRQATVFVFTLGLTEAWVSADDGAVFPVCPGTMAGRYDPQRHQLVNFSVMDVIGDLTRFIDEVRDINPGLRIILTVSPVPLVATATNEHVLCATTYSKSVLRVAAQEVVAARPQVTYFPSYEIVTGPQAPAAFFKPDRRSVTVQAVDQVMRAFLAHCEIPAALVPAAPSPQPSAAESAGIALRKLSREVADAECDEAMLDRMRRPVEQAATQSDPDLTPPAMMVRG